MCLQLVVLALVGCAHDPNAWDGNMLPNNDENANPNPHAINHMLFRKDMPHRDVQSVPFWYQHCEQTRNASYYSKTSYDCQDR